MKPQSSTLEYTVLGIFCNLGPCTTYAVMRELAASPSTYYRKRAGSIYPTVQRLLKQGLIEEVSEAGPRQDTQIKVGEAGVAHLREWLSFPISMAEVAHTVDLIRLRFFFLAALSAEERIRFVEEALVLTREHLRKTEEVTEATV
ncbi:MAG TPA: PadR family transcriptional regulator, partial [Fimbriimonas sp.]|nr:PadR family transcriptional regulator [Fimbriimonas sp.]